MGAEKCHGKWNTVGDWNVGESSTSWMLSNPFSRRVKDLDDDET